MKLNLGSGNDPKEGFVNVDFLDLPEVDYIYNLMDFPYPWDDSSVDEIHAVDVLEHLDNYTKNGSPTYLTFIEECHRMLKPKGKLFIQTPSWDSPLLWIDITHVRGFDLQSFDFFDPDTEFGKTRDFYSTARFKITKKHRNDNGVLQFEMVKR